MALTQPSHRRAGLHTGRRQPIAVRPQAMLEAKDLPRCDLSDYIEHRLQLALGRDRADRARLARVGVEQARPTQPLLVGVGFRGFGVFLHHEATDASLLPGGCMLPPGRR